MIKSHEKNFEYHLQFSVFCFFWGWPRVAIFPRERAQYFVMLTSTTHSCKHFLVNTIYYLYMYHCNSSLQQRTTGRSINSSTDPPLISLICWNWHSVSRPSFTRSVRFKLVNIATARISTIAILQLGQRVCGISISILVSEAFLFILHI